MPLRAGVASPRSPFPEDPELWRCKGSEARRPERVCGPAGLLDRAYPLPEYWPTGKISLVMEQRAATCDLYASSSICCDATRARAAVVIERPVREVIISFLSGCASRPPSRRCLAADLGANNGWMTAFMLSLGANVLSVEPQPDLARAVAETVELNCWSNSSKVLNAFIHPKPSGMLAANGTPWRWDVPQRSAHAQARRRAIWERAPLNDVPTMWLTTALTERRDDIAAKAAPLPQPLHWDFLKLDGDGPENGWLSDVVKLVERRLVTVGAMVVEGNNRMKAGPLMRLQALGFDVYRIGEISDERRYITSRGWDGYSAPGTFGRLDRVRRLRRDDLEEELFGIRAMRNLFRVRTPLNKTEWDVILTPVRRAAPHFVLTTEPFDRLREPSFSDAAFPGRGRSRASPEWLAGGNAAFEPREDGMD